MAYVCRVVAAEGTEIMERADAISTEIFAEFERQFPGWRSE
jgi:hypothetical protein